MSVYFPKMRHGIDGERKLFAEVNQILLARRKMDRKASALSRLGVAFGWHALKGRGGRGGRGDLRAIWNCSALSAILTVVKTLAELIAWQF